MAQHYTRRTVSASAWCAKCQKHTQHRIDDRRVGPCLNCIERLTAAHAENEIEQRRAAKHEQGSLFSEMRA